MSNKIGFWSVFALVTGSQIGTGVLMLPVSLAPFGIFSLIGWLISGCGAIALSLVFAKLCSLFPKTGGPHVYINEAFGSSLAFFVGWTYWLISWISTTAVIITAVTYLAPFIDSQNNFIYLALEILLLLIITGLNLRGLKAAGHIEIFVTILKFIPLIVMSIIALRFFDKNNFVVAPEMSKLGNVQILGKVTLLTLWGFIGLESATTPASSVRNASRTIPKAIIFGTLSVAILYLVNSFGIMGLIPASELAVSKAPYVDAARIIFGGNWHVIISLVAVIACVGTLNAWIMASSQIALGLAEDGFMPSIFARTNHHNAPFFSIITSCLGTIPLLIMTANNSICHQITTIIDFSVTAFLFIYLACSLALIKLIWQRGERTRFVQYIYCSIAVFFCLWIIYETPLLTLSVASLFVFSGIPLFLFWYIKKRLLVTIIEK